MMQIPIERRYAETAVELRLYQRFEALCAELALDLAPPSSQLKNPALAASRDGIAAAAVALLEAATLSPEDCRDYQHTAFCSGHPQVLAAALRRSTTIKTREDISSDVDRLIQCAPVSHILLAARFGLINLTPTAPIVRAAIRRGDADLQNEIVSQTRIAAFSYSLKMWFTCLSLQTLREGADFFEHLLPVYVSRFPEDQSIIGCVTDRQAVHAMALHLAGARTGCTTNRPWDELNSHKLISLLGKSATIAEFLTDAGARSRVEEFLAA